MGQSPSSTSRLDNASTRTLHSTSMSSNRNSNRPMSFFRRISQRISTSHPTRRFGHNRTTVNSISNTSNMRNNATIYTSASSTTSSVRRATQEATRAAAAVTGPPNLPQFLLQQQHNQLSSTTSRNSIISADSASFFNELLNNTTREDSINNGGGGSSFLRYLRIPLRVQQEINATIGGESNNNSTTLQSSASSTSTSTTTGTRRMHILVIEYRSNNTNNANTNTNTNSTESIPSPLPPPTTALPPLPTSATATSLPSLPPSYRFLGLRRPRSELSTNSSTDTIQSMPLSMNSNMSRPQPQQQQQQQQEGQWVVYIVNNTFQTLSSSIDDNNPSYEDLLWLSNMLGNVRPSTTTQSAVDEAIPVIDWSDDTKKQFKDDSCLVCLDEFTLKQPVRILKCHHIFHRECVDRWLCEAHNSCPVCRGVPVEQSSTQAQPSS